MPEEPEITSALVAELVAEQFPQWAHLPITPVKSGGWDNRTFHLGTGMSVRLPSAERYAAKVRMEHEWLPRLAPLLSCPIPRPLGMGNPSRHYPWHWSVYRWIEGETADTLQADNLDQFAMDCAAFLNELHKIETTGGPLAGPHNFYRGAPPSVYDGETRSAISRLAAFINVEAATSLWERAVSTEWDNDSVWIHGDFNVGNLLVKDNRLTAVIDFGGMGVGDPACDLVIAWTFLCNYSRRTFKAHLKLDADTWDRARGWCLWKALTTLVRLKDRDGREGMGQRRIIDTVLSDIR